MIPALAVEAGGAGVVRLDARRSDDDVNRFGRRTVGFGQGTVVDLVLNDVVDVVAVEMALLGSPLSYV